MARKDLSRTVIEGGRTYYNSYSRRQSHGDERASTRAWLDRVANDVEEAEHRAPSSRRRVYKQFHDKLGPAKRWLVAQVGRPWSVVYSELRARFDSRTVAGRHVVEDHMLKWVERHPLLHANPYYSTFALYVDERGILRKPKLHGRGYRKLRKAAEAWAAGRVCALTYRGWWWFRIEKSDPCYQANCERKHVTWVWGEPRYHKRRFLPVAAMTAGELRHLDRLPASLRTGFIVASPWPDR